MFVTYYAEFNKIARKSGNDLVYEIRMCVCVCVYAISPSNPISHNTSRDLAHLILFPCHLRTFLSRGSIRRFFRGFHSWPTCRDDTVALPRSVRSLPLYGTMPLARKREAETRVRSPVHRGPDLSTLKMPGRQGDGVTEREKETR